MSSSILPRGYNPGTDTLTITRTENDLIDTTYFGNIKAYRKNGMLFLKFAATCNGGVTTPSRVEIGRIIGWNAATDILQCIPAQSATTSIFSLQVKQDGVMTALISGTTVAGYYRAVICIPEA